MSGQAGIPTAGLKFPDTHSRAQVQPDATAMAARLDAALREFLASPGAAGAQVTPGRARALCDPCVRAVCVRALCDP